MRTLTICCAMIGLLAGIAAAEDPALPAFPGAEGFGARSAGGRGGRVIKVTTLEPTGPGSLQEACSAKGPRIVVFEVSGVIKAPRRGKYYQFVITEPNITIAGQTAPGAGITIEGMLVTPYRAAPNLHDVTVRFLRVRPPPATAISEGGDCLQLTDIDRLILDHLSCSWGSDENVDVCSSRDLTIQWCAIEESDTKGHSEGQHNFGMIMGYAGRDATVHHNLFAQHSSRAPLCGLETLDHRNNVIYNYKSPLQWHPTRMNYQRLNQPCKANVIGNYFKAGPNAKRTVAETSLDRLMWKRQWVHLFAADNYFDWTGKVAEPTPGRVAPAAATTQPTEEVLSAEAPWPVPTVRTQPAKDAYELVLAQAGCLPRDAVGRRAIEEVRTGGGEWGRHDPEGGLMAGLAPAKPAPDADGDGMPDAWETAHKLDPSDPADATKVVPPGASKDDRHKGYAWIEFYVNELADQLIADAAAEAKSR